MTNRMNSHHISPKNRNLLFIATITLIIGAGLSWMIGSSASTTPPTVRGAAALEVAPPTGSANQVNQPVRSEQMNREFSLLAERAAQEGTVRVIVGLQTTSSATETPSGGAIRYATPELIENL